MGYENKLIIVDVYDSVKNDSGKNWAEVIALLNMCKAGLPVSKFFRPSNCYIYFDGDGDNDVTADMYGEQLTECIDVPGFLEWLCKEYESDKYRRYAVAIELIKASYAQKWHDLRILHYGY